MSQHCSPEGSVAHLLPLLSVAVVTHIGQVVGMRPMGMVSRGPVWRRIIDGMRLLSR